MTEDVKTALTVALFIASPLVFGLFATVFNINS